jgi:hypothetical protein
MSKNSLIVYKKDNETGCEIHINGQWVRGWEKGTPQELSCQIDLLENICKPLGFSLVVVQEDGTCYGVMNPEPLPNNVTFLGDFK